MNESESLARLSRREVECLSLVAIGLQSKEIAPILAIEPGSVDVTLKRAGKKVGISDRRQLAGLLARSQPELFQSTLQRLGQSEKSLVSIRFGVPDERAASVEASSPGSQIQWPLPTQERPWNDLPRWKKRLWSVGVAGGLLAAFLILAMLARTILVTTPHPVKLEFSKG